MNEIKELNDNAQYVVMGNPLIKAKSNLGLNELKLLRLTIMQIMLEDNDFFTYEIKITDLAKKLGISPDNLYRDIAKICDGLMREVLYIGDPEFKKKWIMFNWCNECSYDNGIIRIRLHDRLKPYLINLRGNYTQYELYNIINLKSVYAIRLYEIISERIKCRLKSPADVFTTFITSEDIRQATNTESKYKATGNFKRRVIDESIKEINEKTNFHIDVISVRRGTTTGFEFTVQWQAGYKFKAQLEANEDYEKLLQFFGDGKTIKG